MQKTLSGLLLATLLAGCASSSNNPPQTQQVDLKQYQGTWYELARLPMFFQRNCAQSEAHYTPLGDGTISVVNRCLTDKGEWQQVEGQAVPEIPGQSDKLKVTFNTKVSWIPGVATGDYWILYVDRDYQTAVVGTPNYKNLWLLSRTPRVDVHTRQNLMNIATMRGYDTLRLIWRTPDERIRQP